MNAQATDSSTGKHKRENMTFYGAIGTALGVTLIDVRECCGQRWGGDFEDCEGRRFMIRPTWQNGHRLEISGDYPTTQDGKYAASTRAYKDECNPSITVASTKTPERIAGDIRHRFLPDFAKRWAQVAEHVAESDAFHNQQQATRERLVSLIDGARLSTHSECEVWANMPYRKVQASGAMAELAFYSMEMELAERIIETVEQYRKEHPGSDCC